ncbi:glycerol dehydrogenase [Paracoccus homiensis]|uniref:Glycerol dehydrogenase n=1 Tax=Paracoccus homiensis TaxID=364199 RepID=A0A1I0JEV8_9RHOB|nr:glycerol dehydrogenase [Paracoccus homiensis]SEU08657.1 glycerol dehydrogenase [Paracoccus homiensis]
MRLNSLGFPQLYIQGPGAIDRLGEFCLRIGNRAFVLGDGFVLNLIGARMRSSSGEAGLAVSVDEFRGECCRPEIERLVAKARDAASDVIIAAGGGKAIDTGKVVADRLKLPFVSVPTIASTDGPVSSLAVEYTEDHRHVGVLRHDRAPTLVLVDSQIIADAPPRLLAAGMGDALATWYEAQMCRASGVENFRWGHISPTAMVLAQHCRDTILHHGVAALDALRRGVIDDDLERVIEANLFLSGTGFENTGVAAAHALDGALSRLTDVSGSHHGERVALGVLFLLLLVKDREQFDQVEDFLGRVGLPTRFAALGLGPFCEDELVALSQFVLRDGSPIRNMPDRISQAEIITALRYLDTGHPDDSRIAEG